MDDRMKELLDRAEHLSARDRQLLGAVFDALQEEQAALLGRIREEVRDALSFRAAPEWRVVTALVREESRRQAETDGFFAVLPERTLLHREQMDFKTLRRGEDGGPYDAGLAFLRCRYRAMQPLLRTYQAAAVTDHGVFAIPYRLEFTPCCVEEEERLERTALQNGAVCPPLYAPMSRRAVRVRLELEESVVPRREVRQIDFRYAENGLQDVLLPGMLPMWNVERKETAFLQQTADKITPFGDSAALIYELPLQEREFLLAEGCGWEMKRRADKVYVTLERRDEARFTRFVLHEIPASRPEYAGEYLFENRFDRSRCRKERLRAEADVVYAAECFRPAGLRFEGLCKNLGQAESVLVYDRRRAYHYPKSPCLRKPGCTFGLRFADDGGLYFDDLVSYATAYLNYFYPEFYWTGVL